MTCQEFRDRVTVQLADGSESPGDHGRACAGCARYAELARAAWEAAGRDPEQPLPAALSESVLRRTRAPRRNRRKLLGWSVAAAAAATAVALSCVRPGTPGPGPGAMMWSDGMTVERYELPAGTKADAVAEEIRRGLAPDAWREGVGGLEVVERGLRVRGPSELQRAVRDFLERRAGN
ncbi:MAG: hypothetical protein JO332_12105 [Planctomycetaceae bacterium]|nr:hypothetical protein [Planctomycetaceae bacterium]